MANQEHLDLLKQGVEVWNQWRRNTPAVFLWPDLGKADLRGADLRRYDLVEVGLGWADLRGADLRNCDLFDAGLAGANLSSANLARADLTRAGLAGANLQGADLRGTNLNEANLREVNLREADLRWSNFSEAHLEGVNLCKATVGFTVFGRVDLSVVKGIDAVIHLGPSIIGIDTIYLSQGNIPDTFLQKAGIPDSFIAYARSLVGQPRNYYACFISYSSRDETFAKRLYADLQSKGVRCWFAPEDLKIGDKIRPRIDESIRLYDKLLLVLSQYSVASQWVEQEVETALEKERKESRTVLFPIRLDNTVMDIDGGWPALIRNTRNIGNFTHWKRHDSYQKALERLLRDLKAETSKPEA